MAKQLSAVLVRKVTLPPLIGASCAAMCLAFSDRRCPSAGVECSSASVLGDHIPFAHLLVGASKVFYASQRGAVVYTQLRPVMPGHLVVASNRSVQFLSELREREREDFFETVTTAMKLAGSVSDPTITAFNLLLKDGAGAGQPLPHVHMHIVPRRPADLKVNDEIFDRLDHWSPEEGKVATPPLVDFPEDDKRQPRTLDVMAAEARRYAEAAGAKSAPLPSGSVRFGKYDITSPQVFFVSRSGLTYASVNLKPLVPGHVLVIPMRVVDRITDLTKDELQDLWQTVFEVKEIVLASHGTACGDIGVQDGRDAGQSVPHVHVHILPVGSSKL